MVEEGFLEEARRVLPYRDCNALNTVGYKEIFRYFDGEWALDMALDRMRKNTRVFAKNNSLGGNATRTYIGFRPTTERACSSG